VHTDHKALLYAVFPTPLLPCPSYVQISSSVPPNTLNLTLFIYVFRVALTPEAINRLVCTRDTGRALCELGPGLLYITPLNVSVQKDKNFFSLGSVTFQFINVGVSECNRNNFVFPSQRIAASNTEVNNR